MWKAMLLGLLLLGVTSHVTDAGWSSETWLNAYSNCPSTSNDLCIMAFKVKTFGVNKMTKTDVVAALVEIIHRYDIVVIQDIRDSNGGAIVDLLNEVNTGRSTSDLYGMVVSDRLGRGSSYKEQYAFMFRESRVTLSDTYQYPNNETAPASQAADTTGFYDDFERPPFACKFTRTSGKLQAFAYAALHAKPDDAPEEIASMVDVYNELKHNLSLSDIILGGDFNAGCSYFTQTEMDSNALKYDERFIWAVNDGADTNVAGSPGSPCPYDRFVLGGMVLRNAYRPYSGIEYTYDDTTYTTTLISDISGNYPVEMRVK